tara:strand:+ start:778 stop:1089 length:312 start_codon:yes stop_codon:yes gene_type:complete
LLKGGIWAAKIIVTSNTVIDALLLTVAKDLEFAVRLDPPKRLVLLSSPPLLIPEYPEFWSPIRCSGMVLVTYQQIGAEGSSSYLERPQQDSHRQQNSQMRWRR